MASKTPIQQAVDALSPEKRVGLDVPRQWATGVQVVPGDDFVILVFRDQTSLSYMADDDKTVDRTETLVKNVTSVVMPKKVAAQLAEILKAVLVRDDGRTGD